MKRTKIAKYLKTGILFLGFSLLLWNCEKDEFIEEAKKQDFPFKLKEKTYAELTKTKKFNSAIEKVFKPQKQVNSNYSSKTVMEEQYGFTIDSTIIKEISSDKYTSYTMFIHREEKDDSYYENLLVEIDSVNNISAYILKYIKKSKKIVHEEHGSFSQDVEMQVTRIDYNNTQAKMVFGCKQVWVWYCPDGWEHEAQNTCFKEPWKLTERPHTECGWSDDGSGDGGGKQDDSTDNSNTNDGTPDPHGSGDSITVKIPCVDNCEECSLDELDKLTTTIGLDTNVVKCLKEKEDCAFSNQIADFLKANKDDDDAIAFAKLAAEAKCDGAEIDWEDRIINKLTGKAKCVYDKLKSQSNTLFNSIINNHFGSSKISNIRFSINNISTGEDALTYTTYNSSSNSNVVNNGDMRVILDTNFVNNASNIEIALAIIHEGIHAELLNRCIKLGLIKSITYSQSNGAQVIFKNDPIVYGFSNSMFAKAVSLYTIFTGSQWNHNLFTADGYRYKMAQNLISSHSLLNDPNNDFLSNINVVGGNLYTLEEAMNYVSWIGLEETIEYVNTIKSSITEKEKKAYIEEAINTKYNNKCNE